MSISKLFNSDLFSDRLIVTALLVAVTIASWLFVLNGGGMGMPAHKMTSLDLGEGLNFSVSAGELVNQSIEGLPGADEEAGDPIYLENVPHPANTKLALAKATNSEFHAFGINWEDSTGTRNGHFQRFAWAA